MSALSDEPVGKLGWWGCWGEMSAAGWLQSGSFNTTLPPFATFSGLGFLGNPMMYASLIPIIVAALSCLFLYAKRDALCSLRSSGKGCAFGKVGRSGTGPALLCSNLFLLLDCGLTIRWNPGGLLSRLAGSESLIVDHGRHGLGVW